MDRRTTISGCSPLLRQCRSWNSALRASRLRVCRAGSGYGTDPDLTKVYHAGDLWPLILTPAQRRTASACCDVIIPADSVSRSASAAGVVDFLAEWVSAPYPIQVQDRVLILDGLVWMNSEAVRRFGRQFAALKLTQQRLICDDICFEQMPSPHLPRPPSSSRATAT